MKYSPTVQRIAMEFNLKSFDVFSHPTLGYQAIKHGFSWPAFAFGLFWMLAKKLWIHATAWFVLLAGLSIYQDSIKASTAQGQRLMPLVMILIVYLTLWLVPAFKGNDWRRASLRKRGFALRRTVSAETNDAAIALVAK